MFLKYTLIYKYKSLLVITNRQQSQTNPKMTKKNKFLKTMEVFNIYKNIFKQIYKLASIAINK